MSKRLVYRLLWIPSALAIVGMTLVFAIQPLALPAPEAMKRYTTGDKSFRIQHPGNWKPVERSSHGIETEVEFRATQKTRFIVSTDLTGSLMADLMKSTGSELPSLPGTGVGSADKKKTALENLHVMQAQAMAKNTDEYPAFQDGPPQQTQVAGKEALLSDFTFESRGLLGSVPMLGRRVTLLSGDHHIAIVYICPKEMQSVVLPIFEKMQESLELDPQAGGR